MKKILKGFTLVEILIVIVIIGILIGALVPRMSAAQGRARDVARKNDLSNLQAAILVSYQDKGQYPCSKTGCKDGIQTDNGGIKSENGLNIQDFKDLLVAAGMNTVPGDPLGTNKFKGIGASDQESHEGDYMYITAKSHGIENGGFVLMAKTEVEGSSNWVVCEDTTTKKVKDGLVTKKSDVKDFHACSSLRKTINNENCKNDSSVDGEEGKFSDTPGECLYEDESELRYVIVY